MQFETELPWPPTGNNYYRHAVINGRVSVYLSPKGRAWRENVAMKLIKYREGKLFNERLAVEIIAHPPDRRQRDLDNLLKAPLDSLEYARLFENDNQIDDLHIRRAAPEKPGHVIVRVRAFADAPLLSFGVSEIPQAVLDAGPPCDGSCNPRTRHRP